MMGSGIAASAALAGNEVVLYDADSTITARGVGSARANVRQIVEGGLASDKRAPALRREYMGKPILLRRSLAPFGSLRQSLKTSR